MIVVVNTPLGTPPDLCPAAVTLITRDMFLTASLNIHRPSTGGKIHWGYRNEDGVVVPHCGARHNRAATAWTGTASDLTCIKCCDIWWENQRLSWGYGD